MKSTPREVISKAVLCRSYLYISGFLTDAEAEKVHGRIRKYQDKHRQNVSNKDIESVRLVTDAEIEHLTQRIRQLEGALEDLSAYATIETPPVVTEIINGVLNKGGK